MHMKLVQPLLIGVLIASALSPSFAQDPPNPPKLLGGPGFTFVGGMEGKKLRQLITRPDVQRGLELNLKQQNDITEIFKDPSNSHVQVKLESNGQADPEELKRQAEEQVRAQTGSVEEKVQKILKPEQWDRFVQLDLQWRGPLALSDQKVAERLKIEPLHRQQIEKAAAAYRVEKQEVMMKLAERNDDGNGRVMVRLNTKELDNPNSPSSKQLTKAKQEAEKKILAALSEEETARWNKAQGDSFKFRVDIPGNRF